MVWVRLSPYKIFLGSTRTFDPFLFHLIVHLNTEDVDIVEEDGQDGKGNEEVAENLNISSPDLDTKGQDYNGKRGKKNRKRGKRNGNRGRGNGKRCRGPGPCCTGPHCRAV